MALQGDHAVGDIWIITDAEGGEREVAFVMELPGRQMVLQDRRTEHTQFMGETELDALHASGRARRLRPHRNAKGEIQRTDAAGDVPPEGATDKERARQFYVRKWDETPGIGKGKVGLDRLVRFHRSEASRLGIKWVPSDGALRRAINDRGEPGRRPLRVMQDMRGQGPRNRWPRLVRNALDRAVAWFYAAPARDHGDSYAWLVRLIRRLNGIGARRHGASWQMQPTPCDEVLRLRVHAAASLETFTAKWGEREGRMRYQGVVRGLEAKRILDLIIIDATVADGWCAVDDETRTPLGRPTITYSVDVKSRVCPAFSITYGGENLYGIMSCLQKICTGKHEVIARRPDLAPLLEDIWGKPEEIVVDNAWRQTGVSMQDACEDAGISVRWAAVANPEYKAIGERFVRTVNQMLLHKMPGAVPVDVAMCRKLGIDPQKTAFILTSELEELLYQAIADCYHHEEHRGTGVAPLLAWRKDLASGIRKVIDDPNFLRSVFGAYGEGLLDRSGIQFKGVTFHDPVVTTELLNDLAGATPVRTRRKRGSSATAKVKIKYNPATVAGISVWNPRKRRYVWLPCWDRRFAGMEGASFWLAEQAHAFAREENLAFRSDEDKCLARDRLRAAFEAAAPHMKFAAMRRKRRLHEPDRPVLGGDTVLMAHEIPSISGMKVNDVPVVLAASEREDAGFPEKGPRRGGRKATEKAARTRAAKRAARSRVGTGPPAPPQPSTERTTGSLLTVSDPAAVMAALKARMAAAKGKE